MLTQQQQSEYSWLAFHPIICILYIIASHHSNNMNTLSHLFIHLTVHTTCACTVTFNNGSILFYT